MEAIPGVRSTLSAIRFQCLESNAQRCQRRHRVNTTALYKKARGFKALSYQQRLQELGALSSTAYRVYSDMTFTFKIIKGLTPFTPADFGFTLSKHSRGPMFVLELIKRSRARQFARYRIPRQ